MAIDGIRRAFRLLRGRADVAREVSEEVAFHLERRVEELTARGVPPDEARAEALRAFGDVQRVRRDLERLTRARHGRERRAEWLSDVASDARYAARGMRREWGFTAVALLTLALGIGATTATYSIVDAVLIRPLPYDGADRIVRLWERTERAQRVRVAFPNLQDIREQSRTLTHVAAFMGGAATVLGADESVSAQAYAVTGDFFDVFAVRPLHGRLPSPEELREGGARTAVVSHAFWQRYLGGTERFGDRTLTIYGSQYHVIGILPPGFAYPSQADIWMVAPAGSGESRTSHNWNAIGRLAPGITVAGARAELDAIANRLAAEHAGSIDLAGVTVLELHDAIVGDVRRPLVLIFGAMGFVLLVGCVNLAGANLARAEARRPEMAVRTALGAARGRLVRQLLTENVLLALAGGALGLLVGWVVMRGLVAVAPTNLPRLADVRLDGRVAAFAIALSGVTGILIGLLPAWQVASGSLRDAISAGGRSAVGTGSSRSRTMLIGAEVALVVVLLVGAGLLLRSFRTLLAQDPGFDPAGVLSVRLDVPSSKYQDSTRLVALYDRALDESAGVPGATAAGVINIPPLASWHIDGGFDIAGRSERGEASYRVVGGDYFRAMGVPLVRGRTFDARDHAGAPHAVIVNETAARLHWPGEDPIGQRIRYSGMDRHGSDWMTVIGIVGDVSQLGLQLPPVAETYVSYRQRPERIRDGATIVIRSTTDPAQLTATVRGRLRAIDADVPTTFATYEQVVERSVADRRFTTVVLGAFSLFALFLAAVGIYGVLSYSVSRRAREIGVRMALGAERSRVLRMVLRDGLRAVVPGIAVGAVGALAFRRFVEGMLYGVAPTDPVTFTGVIALLLLVALAASIVPATRATRVDPTVAMRAE